MAMIDLFPAELMQAVATDYLANTTMTEAPLLAILAANGIYQKQRAIEWGAKVRSAVVGGRTITGALTPDENGANVGASMSIADYYMKHQCTIGKRDLVEAWNTGRISSVRDPVGSEIADAVNEMVRRLNKVLYTGTGASDAVSFGVKGLQEVAIQTGDYAGISRTTYPKWRSLVSQGAVPGTPEALTNERVDGFLRLRRAAGAADRGNPDNGLIIVVPDEVEKGAIRTLYSTLVNEQALWTATSKDIQPFVNYYVRQIPVITDLDCPANTLMLLNTSKMAVYGFDDRSANVNNKKVSYVPLHVGNESSTIFLRIADVSDEHPDSYTFELSISMQLAVLNLIDGLSVMYDVANTLA